MRVFVELVRAADSLQEDLAGQTDVIGSADVAPTGMMALFQRAATGSQDRQDVFVLGDRASILHHLDQPAIIPHVAESENKKFSFEVQLRFKYFLYDAFGMSFCGATCMRLGAAQKDICSLNPYALA